MSVGALKNRSPFPNLFEIYHEGQGFIETKIAPPSLCSYVDLFACYYKKKRGATESGASEGALTRTKVRGCALKVWMEARTRTLVCQFPKKISYTK